LFHDLPVPDDESTPEPLRQLLREPLDVTRDWGRAEHLLLRAQAQLPERLEISVALYKMYAYSNRHHEALLLIDGVLCQAAERAGFEDEVRGDRLTSRRFEEATGATRQYLYALKAKAFVTLRMGKLMQAEVVLAQLEALDPFDQVGGSVVADMARRMREAEEAPLN